MHGGWIVKRRIYSRFTAKQLTYKGLTSKRLIYRRLPPKNSYRPDNYFKKSHKENIDEFKFKQNLLKLMFCCYIFFMALFKIVVWAIIFLIKLRFPPRISIATVLIELSISDLSMTPSVRMSICYGLLSGCL